MEKRDARHDGEDFLEESFVVGLAVAIVGIIALASIFFPVY